MKFSRPRRWVLGSLGVCVAALVVGPTLSGTAHAFGGLWSSTGTPITPSAARVVFVDNPGPTITAIVQIRYEGPAQDFVWVIPVPEMPTIEVSSSVVLDRLDAATAPQYWLEQGVDGLCVGQDADSGIVDPSVPPEQPTPVAPIDHGSVGPYEYITAQAEPAQQDPVEAATAWLAMNGYDLTGLDPEVLEPYLTQGWKLLAFKLAKDADIDALRPVALTYASERPTLPIISTVVASQPELAIDVWVFGPAQAVPTNTNSLVLNDALIDWLSVRTFARGTPPAGGAGPFGMYLPEPRNYDAVVAAAAGEAEGGGFVTELGAPASQYRHKVWGPLDDENLATILGESYGDGIDAIVAAKSYYGGWDGWHEAIAGATVLPDGVTVEELASDPEQYRDAATVDTAMFLQRLEERVVKPVMATAAMFQRAPYLTRLHSVLRRDSTVVDPELDYNTELAQLDGVHIARQVIDCSDGYDLEDAPWRMRLPQGGLIAGEGDGAWPVREASLPANLKVVMLSTRGSGTVVQDNSEAIGRALRETAGMIDSVDAELHPPQNGLTIGGRQTVIPADLTKPPESPAPPAKGEACSVSRVGAGSSGWLGGWLLALTLGALRRPRAALAYLLALFSLTACDSEAASATPADGGEASTPGALTREQLRDPESCKGCHPIHYREWSGSMHAYAAQDPVFIAMNKRGQRETNGELGDFCVKCHAPMAVVDGLTKDGLNLDELADKDRGVSCYFCHNTVEVEGDHNAMLRIADDTTMRGPIRDPLTPVAHRAEYSDVFEFTSAKSSAMCGGCHDIETPNGVHIERTLKEYRSGIFSKSADGTSRAFDSCVGCHMPSEQGLAANVPGAVERPVHEHFWPGVDVALTDFPHREAMRSAVEDCQLGAPSVTFFTLEVTPPDLFTFQIETGAGHNQPSGAAQDRRMWIEFLAYDDSGALIEEASSGNIADDEIEEKPPGDPKHDPHLAMFRDRMFDADGKPVHMFWEAAKSEAYPEGYESNTLPVATTTYISGERAVLKQFRASGPNGLPARVTARLRMRPIGLDVLQDLVDSGDLDPAIMDEMPTFSFGAQIDWTPDMGLMTTVSAVPKTDCTTYRCLLDPTLDDCR